MAASPLKKSTRNGFTVLPNKIIDEILQSSGKNIADTLALLIYCVRHIPSQSGTLSLHGNFSQTAICTDLGWGPTNKQRLKRASQHLETAGVLNQELRDNNVLLFHIKAELENQISDVKQAGRGGEENSQPAAKIPCDQGAKIPSTPYIENKYINNSQENLLEKKSIQESKTIAKTSVNPNHDEDLEKLFDLYRNLLEKPITPKHRELFTKTYLENAKPYTQVEKAIRTLSKHPKLHKDTVSINAVWQLPFMLRAARQFEANVRDLLRNLRENGCSDVEQRIITAAKESGVDIDLFKAFFADDIPEISAKNTSTEENPTHYTQDNDPQFSRSEVAKTETHPLQSTTSIHSPLTDKPTLRTTFESAISVTEELRTSAPEGLIPPNQVLADSLGKMSKVLTDTKLLPLCFNEKNPQSTITLIKNSEDSPIIDIVERLIRAPTKVEFLSLIKATLEAARLEIRDKEILTALMELTILPNANLNILKTSVTQRFRLRKAS